MNPTKEIRQRLKEAGAPFAANDNIAQHLNPGDLDMVRNEVAQHAQAMLDALLIDTQADHNTHDTAQRIAKMYVDEVFSGRFNAPPKITDFPNARELDEIYTLGPIAVRSTCSHHFAPITGRLWVGIIPGERVIGISKFARLARWVMERPQIQEEAAVMLADEIEARIKPKGLALVIEAEHTCMTWRGVKENGVKMKNSIMRGVFRDNSAARNEFLALVAKGE